MRSTSWTCDNYCGAKVVGDHRPDDWYLISVNSSMFVACSPFCLAHFAWKAQHGIPMGDRVEVTGYLLIGDEPDDVALVPTGSGTSGEGGKDGRDER